jgi:hypothetical protein
MMRIAEIAVVVIVPSPLVGEGYAAVPRNEWVRGHSLSFHTVTPHPTELVEA